MLRKFSSRPPTDGKAPANVTARELASKCASAVEPRKDFLIIQLCPEQPFYFLFLQCHLGSPFVETPCAVFGYVCRPGTASCQPLCCSAVPQTVSGLLLLWKMGCMLACWTCPCSKLGMWYSSRGVATCKIPGV